MHRLGIVGLFVALTALVACSNDDSSTGGPAPVGPAPASKQAAAEDLNEATAALSGALSESKGSTKTKAAGLAPQTTVSVSGSCAGGGTLDATASADANVNGGSSGQSSSAVVDYTIKGSQGDVVTVTATLTGPATQLFIEGMAATSGQPITVWAPVGNVVDVSAYAGWTPIGHYRLTVVP